MDDKRFKAHLKALAEGHHHLEEHDWDAEGAAKVAHAPRNGHKPTESSAAKGKAGRRGTSRARIKR